MVQNSIAPGLLTAARWTGRDDMKACLIDPQKLRFGRGRPGSRYWFENFIKEEKLDRVVADGPDVHNSTQRQ